jgi:hypothetical protein
MGLLVLKVLLKARSRDVGGPFDDGGGYGRVRGSAITGYTKISN